jgi:hypothetical protein
MGLRAGFAAGASESTGLSFVAEFFGGFTPGDGAGTLPASIPEPSFSPVVAEAAGTLSDVGAAVIEAAAPFAL